MCNLIAIKEHICSMSTSASGSLTHIIWKARIAYFYRAPHLFKQIKFLKWLSSCIMNCIWVFSVSMIIARAPFAMWTSRFSSCFSKLISITNIQSCVRAACFILRIQASSLFTDSNKLSSRFFFLTLVLMFEFMEKTSLRRRLLWHFVRRFNKTCYTFRQLSHISLLLKRP